MIELITEGAPEMRAELFIIKGSSDTFFFQTKFTVLIKFLTFAITDQLCNWRTANKGASLWSKTHPQGKTHVFLLITLAFIMSNFPLKGLHIQLRTTIKCKGCKQIVSSSLFSIYIHILQSYLSCRVQPNHTKKTSIKMAFQILKQSYTKTIQQFSYGFGQL